MFVLLSTVTIVAGLLLAARYILYFVMRPRPIPGIPYHKPSGKRTFGDIMDAVKVHEATGEISAFFRDRCEQLNSPVIQVFLRTFGIPSVVITDSREALDIMGRRSREFDRAPFLSDIFRAAVPYHQVTMRTTDQWRYNRRLVSDTMTPQFLNTTAAPQVFKQCQAMIDLWSQKMRLAQGHAFDVKDDMSKCTVDTIWGATFGTDIGSSKTQSAFLAKIDDIPLPASADDLIAIPTTEAPTEFTAITTVAQSSDIALHSPFGWRAHWYSLRFNSAISRANTIMKALVNDQVQSAWKKFGQNSDGSGGEAIKSAVDLVVKREVTLAKKESRAPLHDSVYVKNELSGFLIAGYETTSTAMSWALKFLTEHQGAQKKLREALRTALGASHDTETQLEAEVLAKLHVPYLEAFIEETLRFGCVVPANARITTMETEVLGYMIPKGVEVLMMNNGPSVLSKPVPYDESRRSQTSRDTKEITERWDQADLDVFNPERWLVKKEDGSVQFDSRAAPQQAMGAGPRSCFGKRLAYLEMRIIFSLIVLNFELLPIAESLVDFKAVDEVTHHPRTVRIRLTSAN